MEDSSNVQGDEKPYDYKKDLTNKLSKIVPGPDSETKDQVMQSSMQILWSSWTPWGWFFRFIAAGTNQYNNTPDDKKRRLKKRLIVEVIILLLSLPVGIAVASYFF